MDRRTTARRRHALVTSGVLCDALQRHDAGETNTDPSTADCGDADRLCLARLGVEVNPELLSTEAARALAADVGRLVSRPIDARWLIYRFSLAAEALALFD